MSNGTFYCFDCGEELPNIAKFCPECGTKLNMNSEPEGRESTKNEEKQGYEKVTNDYKEETKSNTDLDSNDLSNENVTEESLLGNVVGICINLPMIVVVLLMLYHVGIYILSGDVFTAESSANWEASISYLYVAIFIGFIDMALTYVWEKYPSPPVMFFWR